MRTGEIYPGLKALAEAHSPLVADKYTCMAAGLEPLPRRTELGKRTCT